MKVKRESEVAQSCLTLSDPVDYSLLGSFVHGIFQARGLEWVASAFSVVKSSTYQIPIVGARQAVVALPEGAQKASIYPMVC